MISRRNCPDRSGRGATLGLHSRNRHRGDVGADRQHTVLCPLRAPADAPDERRAKIRNVNVPSKSIVLLLYV